MSRKATLISLALVLLGAATLGAVAWRLELATAESRFHAKYFMASPAAAPVVALLVTLIGVTVLAQRIRARNWLIEVAWGAGASYIGLRLGLRYTFRDAVDHPDSLLHVIHPRGGLAILWSAHAVTGVAAALLASMALLLHRSGDARGMTT
jgi:hypothetical protein